MLGLPGYYLGAPNSSRTYSNVEQEQLQFLRGITPLLTRIEMAFTDLLPRGQYAKFNTDALLRSDTLTRYQAHKIAIESGFLTVDEVRADFENRPTDRRARDNYKRIGRSRRSRYRITARRTARRIG
jgi:hypothetical protein